MYDMLRFEQCTAMMAIIQQKGVNISSSTMTAVLFILFLSSNSPKDSFNWDLASALKMETVEKTIPNFIEKCKPDGPPN